MWISLVKSVKILKQSIRYQIVRVLDKVYIVKYVFFTILDREGILCFEEKEPNSY